MSSYEKHTGQQNNERFEPRNHVISKWDMIVRVSLVLLLTSSTDKDRNPVPGIRNPGRRIQNPRLSLIPLHGVTTLPLACSPTLLPKKSDTFLDPLRMPV